MVKVPAVKKGIKIRIKIPWTSEAVLGLGYGLRFREPVVLFRE
jgi:hypothetical protein